MKNVIKNRMPALFLVVLFSFFGLSLFAQDNKSERKAAKISLIKTIVDTQNFVFVPRSVTPLRGGTRQLTSYYQLTVAKDSIISYLPYFGRAFTAPINSRDNALDFTSTDFAFNKAAGKKGGWQITIKPKDQPGAQQFIFTIYENGNAFLNVSNVNRDAISYQGYITERKGSK